jgi:1,4-alpha-glucan branching enzyme
MAKKDDVKKTTGKTVKTGKPAKAVKARTAEAKVQAKTDKKPVAQKRPTLALAKAKATLKLRAPQAEQVFLAGCFNEWDPAANPLERDSEGTWSCTLVIDPGEHEYRFVVDGVWCDDPANMMRHPNGFGTENCVLII